MAETQFRQGPSRVPLFKTMQKVPAGLMLIPLVLGVLINSFAPDALRIGGFTQALFKDGALAPVRPAVRRRSLLVRTTGCPFLGVVRVTLHNS